MKSNKSKSKIDFMQENLPTLPKDTIDHKSIILDKDQIKKRNEANKDYTKMFDKTTSGRGPGRGMYLGSKPKNSKGTILRILSYLNPYTFGLVTVFLAIILTSALGVLIPWLFGYTIDQYIMKFDYNGAAIIALFLIGIAVFSSAARFVSRYVLAVISQKAIKQIRKDAFDNLQNLPVQYYDTNQPGDIVSRITNDVDLISNSLASVVSELIGSLITLIGSLIMMFFVNYALALVVLLFVPIMIILTSKISKITRKGFVAQQKHLGALNGIIEESISGLKVIKLYSQENDVIVEFDKKNNELKKTGFKAQVYAGVVMPVINFLNNLIYVIIVSLGGLLYISGKVLITVGDISAITSYARQFIQPIANLAQLFNTLQQGLAGAERVFQLIDEKTEYENDGEMPIEKIKGLVEFKNVTFGYEDDKPVLKNITFEAEEGKITAIVGPTGSGKTTIINLLNRFYDVNSGSIEIDHQNLYSYQKNMMRKRIGVVLQDTILFS
ncbi:MAG: ABC transporter ATP-binding protein, partial [Firmicutes bacterium]|nr:ABC transporter ATP-binding protein [Bacillota bacterium]